LDEKVSKARHVVAHIVEIVVVVARGP
jgi:hypothetical protein